MIAWTIWAARESEKIQRVIVSSEDKEIQEISEDFGAEIPFSRPTDVSEDRATKKEVVLHAIEKLDPKPDIIIYLQPTSPLRKAEHIDQAIETFVKNNANSLASVRRVSEHPNLMCRIEADGTLKPKEASGLTQRQSFESLYILEGSIFIVRTDWFLKNRCFFSEDTLGYVIDENCSVDIDTDADLDWCNHLMLNDPHYQMIREKKLGT